jgi:hypothetical protein
MGWSNFIIIPSLNIAIEVSRDLHDLADYEEKALDYLTSEEYDIDRKKLEKEGCKIIWR